MVANFGINASTTFLIASLWSYYFQFRILLSNCYFRYKAILLTNLSDFIIQFILPFDRVDTNVGIKQIFFQSISIFRLNTLDVLSSAMISSAVSSDLYDPKIDFKEVL